MENNRKLRVYHFMNNDIVDGCAYYRNILPLVYLNEAGIVEANYGNKVKQRERVEKDTDKHIAFEYEIGFIKWCDVLVFSRYYNNKYTDLIEFLVRVAKDLGKKIIYETDDNVIDIPESNPVASEAIPSVPLTKFLIEQADAFTVTTARLGKMLQEINNKPYFVLPNSLELFRFENPRISHRNNLEEIRIGWSGGQTHIEDMKLMLSQIKELKEKYNITFVHNGSKETNALIDFEHEHFDFVAADRFPQYLASLALDIGLIPLEEGKFNSMKSVVKWEEYSAVGAASVYSDVPPYSDVLIDGKLGLAVKDNDWKTPIEKLIKDAVLRKGLAQNAYAEVFKNYNMEKNIALWFNAYREVASLS